MDQASRLRRYNAYRRARLSNGVREARQLARVLSDVFSSGSTGSFETRASQVAPGSGLAKTSSNADRLPGLSAASSQSTTGGSMAGGSSRGAFGGGSSTLGTAAETAAGTPASAFDARSTASGGGQSAFEGIKISADVSTNSLLIFASAENYRIIEQTIRQLDQPQAQVGIERNHRRGHEKYWFSTNGGNNWTSNNLGINNITYFSIDFVNRDTGWIGGTNGVLFKTTNCGLNWVQKNTGTDTRFYGLSFTTKDTGWAGGFNSSGESKILFTSTGGESWIVKYIDPIGQGVEDIFFTSAKEGWAMGLPGKIMHTTDVGNTWEFQNSNAGNIHLFSGYFINSTTGWIVGEAGGANGKILKTTTGGIVPVENIKKKISKNFVLHQNYPNPFNSSTVIKFEIPKSSFVILKVYDITGREVAALINNNLITGIYESYFEASKLSSGIYYYRLVADNYTETKKLILIK